MTGGYALLGAWEASPYGAGAIRGRVRGQEGRLRSGRLLFLAWEAKSVLTLGDGVVDDRPSEDSFEPLVSTGLAVPPR